MRLLRDLVLVRVDAPSDKSKSGIMLVETFKDQPPLGEVISVGPDAKNVKEGDRILFSRYSALDTDEELDKIIQEAHIMAVI